METREHAELAAVTLLASAARTVSAAGADVVSGDLQRARAIRFIVNIPTISGTTPTLDVEIQVKIPGTNSYTRLVTFSQVTTGTIIIGREVKRTTPGAAAVGVQYTLSPDPGLTAAGATDIEWSDTFRVKFVIGGTTPSYTFSVTAQPLL